MVPGAGSRQGCADGTEITQPGIVDPHLALKETV